MPDLRIDERTRDAAASYAGKLPQPKGPLAQELLLALGPDESVERFVENGTVAGQSIYTALTNRRLVAVMEFVRTRVRSVSLPLSGVLLSGGVSGGQVLNLVADVGTPVRVTVRRFEDIQALLAAGATNESADSQATAGGAGRQGVAASGRPSVMGSAVHAAAEAANARSVDSAEDVHRVVLEHVVRPGFSDAVLAVGDAERGLAVARARAAAQVTDQGTPVSARRYGSRSVLHIATSSSFLRVRRVQHCRKTLRGPVGGSPVPC